MKRLIIVLLSLLSLAIVILLPISIKRSNQNVFEKPESVSDFVQNKTDSRSSVPDELYIPPSNLSSGTMESFRDRALEPFSGITSSTLYRNSSVQSVQGNASQQMPTQSHISSTSSKSAVSVPVKSSRPTISLPPFSGPAQSQISSRPVSSNKPVSSSSTAGNTNASFAEQVVKLVNEERAKEGLSPLAINSSAKAAAQIRAKEITSSFSHTRPDGKSFSTALTEQGVKFRTSGENIAWGQRTPQQVVEGWMNSSGHRANILNSKFTAIGVGHYQNASGVNYWVQLFIG